MTKTPVYALLCSTLFALSMASCTAATPSQMPEFHTDDPKLWFNSKPLKRADLRGKVVLIDVWTFGCWNCYRSFPWLKKLEQRMAGKPFTVVGIHSPEFGHEKDPAAVATNIKKFGLEHPVVMDNDHAYWRSLANRYWPAFYLVDKQGRIRKRFIGETHEGDRNATQIEEAIRQLLAESA